MAGEAKLLCDAIFQAVCPRHAGSAKMGPTQISTKKKKEKGKRSFLTSSC